MKAWNKIPQFILCLLLLVATGGFSYLYLIVHHIPALAIHIRVMDNNLKIGDPIPIEFSIKNVDFIDYNYLDLRGYDPVDPVNYSPEFCKLVTKFGSGQEVCSPRKDNRPKDHCVIQGYTGPGFERKVLKPGQSFTTIILLNRHAALTKPGIYTITGIYQNLEDKLKVTSKPIKIQLAPRTKSEMNAYIAVLENELKQSSLNNPDRRDIIQKLTFTHDQAVIPILIDFMYHFVEYSPWNEHACCEALSFYLPADKVRPAILRVCRERGLTPGYSEIIKDLAMSIKEQEWKEIIKRSLAVNNKQYWHEGCLAAFQHPDISYTEKLITIANDPDTDARHQAIYDLALIPSDTSTKALKKLVTSADKSIRQAAKEALEEVPPRK